MFIPLPQVPDSPLLLSAVVPLLKALSRASRPSGNPQLGEKLKAVIKNRLCRCRPAVSVGETTEKELTSALQKALYYAGRDKESAVNEAAGKSPFFCSLLDPIAWWMVQKALLIICVPQQSARALVSAVNECDKKRC